MISINSFNTITSLNTYNSKLNISHDKLHLKSFVDSGDVQIIVNSTSLINKYYDFIKKILKSTTLTDKEYMTYRFQPKMYCNDMYGTTELWSLLLKVNNWTSVAEFNSKTFKSFNWQIFDVLNTILILEKDNINDNRAAINY